MAETEEEKETPSEAEQPKGRKTPLYRNGVSFAGGIVVVISAVLILFALLTQLTMHRVNPYVGIITYLVFPAILVLGVALVLGGMRWEAGRRKKHQRLPHLPYPQIDLNLRRQRRIFAYSVGAGTILAVIIAWASYQGFLFTESVTFCGQTCHVPMEPEFTAYQESAHARVPCVDCHVGEGAGWYVRSKLSGARQVFAVLFETYEKPIPTPIEHLRPARETCEECHWPEKFFGAKMLQLPHYRYNEDNSPEQISLLLKVGGGSKKQPHGSGIHWHMLIENDVQFAAADDKLQVIPWVKITHSDGTSTVFKDKDTRLTDEEIAELPRQTMDCMDCHNRPAHTFPTPDSGVDDAMLHGVIPDDLPWIKKVAVNVLFEEYESEEAAHAAIESGIRELYEEEHPEVWESRKDDIESTIEEAKSIWDRGVFPKMDVSWKTYPNNIGHRYWPGCFRCHDGRHVSEDGEMISRDCGQTCHTRPERGSMTDLGSADPFPADDWHPWAMPEEHIDIQGHDKVLCHECHLAGQRPSKECSDCHEE